MFFNPQTFLLSANVLTRKQSIFLDWKKKLYIFSCILALSYLFLGAYYEPQWFTTDMSGLLHCLWLITALATKKNQPWLLLLHSLSLLSRAPHMARTHDPETWPEPKWRVGCLTNQVPPRWLLWFNFNHHQFFAISLNPFRLLWQNISDWMAYKPQKFIAHSSVGWKSKIEVPGWGPFPGCQLLLLSCNGVSSQGTLWGLFYKGTNSRAEHSWPSHLPKPHLVLPNLGISYQHINLRGIQTFKL